MALEYKQNPHKDDFDNEIMEFLDEVWIYIKQFYFKITKIPYFFTYHKVYYHNLIKNIHYKTFFNINYSY